MKYELIQNSDVGVITDPTPVLRDIKDTFTVSFVLPEESAYVALFRDESGAEYRATIKDGVVKVPKRLLIKEQRVGLTVCQISDDAILHSWICPTLKIGTFISLRQTQWQITVGTDDKELYARLADIERANVAARDEYAALLAEFDKLQAEYSSRVTESEQALQVFAEQLDALTKTLASVKAANENIATEYNKSIQVINDLSERLAALESNYDPTVIK